MTSEHNANESFTVASPETLGFDSDALQNAFRTLDDAVHHHGIPGAVALVGRGSRFISPYAVGYAQLQPERVPMREHTIFDMASVTKVVATTTAACQLLDAGEWRLDDPVTRFWPQFSASNITLRHLLTHTSGLPAWHPLYNEGQGPQEYRRILETMSLQYKTGTKVIYSCLGFIILGSLIELVTQQSFADYCREYIFSPLGMNDTVFCPTESMQQRCAATEWKPDADAPLQGVVHDENARVYGGDAGNAGLFSTARDMGIFCAAMLNKGIWNDARILSPAVWRVATTDYTSHLNESRGLGWVIHGDRPRSSAGDLFSPFSFGHTGFTGTSIWIDPRRDVYVVLLTNRVHPNRNNTYHIRLRALFHNAVAASLQLDT